MGTAVRFRQPVGREGFYTFGNRERNEGSGRYSVLEAKKDRSIASIDFGHPSFSSQDARAFGHPSAAAARPRRHRPYEDPPRPIPIPRPDEPRVIDNPPPRRKM